MRIEMMSRLASMLTLGVLMPAFAAQAEDWRVTPLAMDGWSVHEQGQAEEPGGYQVKEVYSTGEARFEFGCVSGYGLYVSWDPKKTLEGSILVPVTFSVNGETLFERSIATNDRRDYSWLDRGEGTDADTLVVNIWEQGAGTLTISGGGATSTIPFDEERNDYWSEEILFACGLM